MDRALLNKATSADETPTPGFMYAEIIKITYAGPQACEQLEDYLLKKLPKDNAHVKLKCLRVIKQVCEKGRPDFKRSIQKRADIIKACQTFRGQQDPLRGDAPNKEVRDEAEECLKVVFNSAHQNAYGQVTRPQEMQGFGSSNYDKQAPSSSAYSNSNYGGGASYQGSYGGAGSKFGVMQGVGNTDFDNAQETPTLLQRASDSAWALASKVTGKLPKSLNRTGYGLSGHGDFNEAPLPGGPTWQPPPMPGTSSWQPAHQPANRWGNDSASNRWGNDSRPQVANSGENSGQYESRMVDDLCAPGGARVALSQPVLEEFCQKCETLDADTIADLLVQKMLGSDWQIKLKALCATEALVDANLDGITGGICERGFAALNACKDVPQCRARAQKVLRLLGFESVSVGDLPAPSPAAASTAPVGDLLDFGSTAVASANLGETLLSDPGPGGLFSGLGVHTSAPAPNVSLLDDILGPSVAAQPSDLVDFAAPQTFVPIRQSTMAPSQSSTPPTTARRDAHLDALSLSSRSMGVHPMGVAPLLGNNVAPMPMGTVPMGTAVSSNHPMSVMANGLTNSLQYSIGSPNTTQALGSFTQPPVSPPSRPPVTQKSGASAFNFIAAGKSLSETTSSADNFNFVESHMRG